MKRYFGYSTIGGGKGGTLSVTGAPVGLEQGVGGTHSPSNSIYPYRRGTCLRECTPRRTAFLINGLLAMQLAHRQVFGLSLAWIGGERVYSILDESTLEKIDGMLPIVAICTCMCCTPSSAVVSKCMYSTYLRTAATPTGLMLVFLAPLHY